MAIMKRSFFNTAVMLLLWSCLILTTYSCGRGSIQKAPSTEFATFIKAYSGGVLTGDNPIRIEFAQDIPLSTSHRSYEALKTTGERLNVFKDEQVALIWGVKDWCFPPEVFMAEFLKYYPNAFTRRIEDAGHYLLEDSPRETLAAIREFLEK